MPGDARRFSPGADRQVGPVANGSQERLAGVPAHTGALVDFKVANAFVVAVVEVGAGRDAGLFGGGRERIEDLPPQALTFHPPFTTGAPAAGVEPGRCVVGGGPAMVIFVGQERRQTVGPAPTRVGAVPVTQRPGVVVARLTTHVDHAVDAAAASEGAATRVAQAAAVEAGFRFRLVQPVGARVADAVEIADGNVDPRIGVRPAGFEQQHTARRVGTQAVGEQAAGRAGPDDDHVVGGMGHRVIASATRATGRA
jgi:hypothetical protein